MAMAANLSSNEQFQKVLAIADSEIKRKNIQIRFGPAGKMRFIIDDTGLKEALAPTGIDEAGFRECFDGEIGPLLDAILRGLPEQFIDIRFSQPADPKARAEQSATLRERAEIVKAKLVTDDLRARYAVKAFSKLPRLRTSGWEVSMKIELPAKASLQPYVTLSFETVLPQAVGEIFTWFPFSDGPVGQSDFCVFDCDDGDIDDLIKMLKEAQQALRKAQI
jgi:hypothetical protein